MSVNPAGGSPLTSLANIRQIIAAAQELDAKDNELGAHKQYLLAVQHISSLLQQCRPDHTGQDGISPAVAQKLYKMSRHCLERAEEMFNKVLTEGRSFKSLPPPPLTSHASLPGHVMSNQLPTNKLRHRSVTVYPYPHHPTANISALHKISPLEVARKKNYHLMSQYQTTLRNNRTASLPSTQNLSLGYLRRMEENLSIARNTERSMSMKLRQREARKMESINNKQKSMDGLSMEELKIEVTTFESHKTSSNINNIKHQLMTNPSSTDTIISLVHEVLNMAHHPLCRLFGECQYSIVQLIRPAVIEIERAGPLPHMVITKDDGSTIDGSRGVTDATTGGGTRRQDTTSSTSSSTSDTPVSTGVSRSHTTGSSTGSPTTTASNEGVVSSTDDVILPNDGEDEDEFVSMMEYKPDDNDVVFPSLIHLTCTLHYGNTHILNGLSSKLKIYLDGAIKLIHSALDKLVDSFINIYHVTSDDNIEVCRTALETMFFPAILPMLTTVHRVMNYDNECKLMNKMKSFLNATPKDLSVRRKLWLEDEAEPPYNLAINQLKKLLQLQTPSTKLDCLVELSKCIVQSIEDYHKPKEIAVGVDDILPIMSYVIIKSFIPELISECNLLHEFIHDSYMMGEEGFCLTTFDTALKYVQVMSHDE